MSYGHLLGGVHAVLLIGNAYGVFHSYKIAVNERSRIAIS